MLCRKSVEEFRKIYKKDYGVDSTHGEALDAATKILNLIRNSKYEKIFLILFTAFLLTGCTSVVSNTNQLDIEKASDNKTVEVDSKDEVKDEEIIVEKNTEEEEEEITKQYYKVVKVVDGDTVIVNINGSNETLRLIGIDTPETVDPRKPVECFGVEASNKAKELLNGKRVALEADPSQGERGKYGRLLRYIFLENGVNFNELMIKEGYAYEYTYNFPYKYQSQFKQAQQEAQTAKRGLWADGVCDNDDDVVTTPSPNPPIQEAQDIDGEEEVNKEVSTPPSTECDCSGNTKNCSDFKTHQEAQALFECCMQKVGTDIHRLDRDKDGKVCESLP